MKRPPFRWASDAEFYYAVNLDSGVMMGGEHREDAALLHAADQDLISHIVGVIVYRFARLVTKQQVFADRRAVRRFEKGNRLLRRFGGGRPAELGGYVIMYHGTEP